MPVHDTCSSPAMGPPASSCLETLHPSTKQTTRSHAQHPTGNRHKEKHRDNAEGVTKIFCLLEDPYLPVQP
jgi:hypothetical protein